MNYVPSGHTVPIHELQQIRLRSDFATRDGTVAAGTIGTVLQVFDDGSAFQVEFEGEHDIPETVGAEMIVAVNAAER